MKTMFREMENLKEIIDLQRRAENDLTLFTVYLEKDNVYHFGNLYHKLKPKRRITTYYTLAM